MEVRKFGLINEKGEEYSLMDIENYGLLTEPQGLGFEYSIDYEKIGNMFVENKRTLNQNVITGTYNTIGYENYYKFVNFIEKSVSLRLHYVIPYENNLAEYYRDVVVSSLDKSEIQLNGVISENIQIECKSLWYSINEANYIIQAQEDEVRWNFKWDSRFVSYSGRSLNYINKGHVEASIQLVIDGEVVNPVLTLYVEGTEVQRIPFTCTINEYEKFMYSSKDGDSYVKKQNTDGTYTDLYNLTVLEFNNNNILKLPVGKNSEVRITADDDISKATLQVFTYYKAV